MRIKLATISLTAILTFYIGATTTTFAHNDNSLVQQQDNGVGWCSWSPDGKTIAFDAQIKGNKDIYTISADGSDLRRLTNLKAVDSLPAWSPDSEKILFFSDRGANGDIWIMDADGSDP